MPRQRSPRLRLRAGLAAKVHSRVGAYCFKSLLRSKRICYRESGDEEGSSGPRLDASALQVCRSFKCRAAELICSQPWNRSL